MSNLDFGKTYENLSANSSLPTGISPIGDNRQYSAGLFSLFDVCFVFFLVIFRSLKTKLRGNGEDRVLAAYIQFKTKDTSNG